jgi:uncharacterized protein
VKFEWDSKKAKSNVVKHSVSFDEAKTAFDDVFAAYYADRQFDDRFIVIGFSAKQRILYVVYASVVDNVIRIISARKATSHEKTRYQND